MEHSCPDPTRRALITAFALFAVMMVTLDGTIAIIALPSIQSALSASQEQIAWVLTSYLIAGAIGTPLSGWLADRYGRAWVMAMSVGVFTLASLGCGLAWNLEVLVLFRVIQGFSGASLVPISQVLLLDIYPPDRHGPAIAWFGMGTLFGPMIGPTLGAWLTEYVSWHWIFLINLPIGIVAFVGLMVFARGADRPTPRKLDLQGFVMLSISLTAFQLMLDRGQLLDWFASTEIWIEAIIAVTAGYLAVVHFFTTATPFIKPATFRDNNFVIGMVLSVVLGLFLNGVVPIVSNLMQQLLGYPVMLAGLLSLPRAIGNMLTIFLVGRLVSHIEPRLLIFAGMVMLAGSLWLLSGLSLDARQSSLALIGFMQGCGSGLVFLPLMLVMFSTLPDELRNEAATLAALVRSLGGAAGISLIQTMAIRNTAEVQSRLVEHVRPDNPVVGWRAPDFDLLEPGSVAAMMSELSRQAAMVAYVDSFSVILALALVSAPLCLLMRTRGGPAPREERPAALHAE